jgi:DNA-binding transcriptional MocR family regulator
LPARSRGAEGLPRPAPAEVRAGRRTEAPSPDATAPFRGQTLAKGIPDLELLPYRKLGGYLANAARNLGPQAVAQDDPRGLPALREVLARHALEAGVFLGPDDILVTTGALHSTALALGLRVLEIPTSARDGMNLDLLGWALDHHQVTVVISVPTYNNPTGFLMPEHRKQALVELLAPRPIPLIEDDAYGDLTVLDRRPAACKSFDAQGLVVYTSSVSKSLAPGYRIGWLAGGRWHQDLVEWKRLNASAASLPAEWAVARFLGEGNDRRHLRNLARKLAGQVTSAIQTVVNTFPEGTVLEHPTGGLFLWITLPGDVDTEVLLAQAGSEGVFFRPGAWFSASGKFRNQLRLAIGTWNDAVQAALGRLGEPATTLETERRSC